MSLDDYHSVVGTLIIERAGLTRDAADALIGNPAGDLDTFHSEGCAPDEAADEFLACLPAPYYLGAE